MTMGIYGNGLNIFQEIFTTPVTQYELETYQSAIATIKRVSFDLFVHSTTAV